MKRGFTLVELLVVVLIIGVLSAIAIPMYQGAVDKSHWSTMLPGAKAIKDAEEAIKMTNGAYTDEMANLDVTMNNADLTFALLTPNNTADPNVIRVTNSKLANVRLASYLDDNPKFAGQLHCEAKTGDERANKLCEKLLMGQELTEQDGYVGYLLDQEIDQASCDNASRSWSSSKTKCYKDDQSRCNALNMNYLGDDQCGYEDANGQTFGEEGICIGYQNPNDYWSNVCRNSIVNDGGVCQAIGRGACNYSTINEGGVCDASSSYGEACQHLIVKKGGMCLGSGGTNCAYSTIEGTVICEGPIHSRKCGLSNSYNGGICVGNVENGCRSGTYSNGSICYANAKSSCWSNYESNTYDSTSCCCGAYCNDAVPKCAPSRCDPQYMK